MGSLWDLKKLYQLIWEIYEILNSGHPISFPQKTQSKQMCCCYGIYMELVIPQLSHTMDSVSFSSHTFSIHENMAKLSLISVPYLHPTFPYHSQIWVIYGPCFAISFPYFFFGKGKYVIFSVSESFCRRMKMLH